MTKPSKHTGRRPGKTDTHQSILGSAQKLFAEVGYDKATIRAIAEDAHVDPALISHYFGTKQELFLASMLPIYKGSELLSEAMLSTEDEIEQKLAGLFVQLTQDKETLKILIGMIRSATTDEKAAEMVKEFVETKLVKPMSLLLTGDNPDLRASLIGSHMIGIIITKYIVKAEPLASASSSDIAAQIGPAIEKYMT